MPEAAACLPPDSLPSRLEIGTHCLSDFASDVVGNAAALDVYKFLKLEYQGQTLLQMLQADDADLLQALHHDSSVASQWRAAFCSITEAAGGPASHVLAKQIYWPVSPDDYPADANDDSHYHLLSILNSSAVSHWLYGRIQEHRFGDAAKAARQANATATTIRTATTTTRNWQKRKRRHQAAEHLAAQQRTPGSNYLLASLPPQWDSRKSARLPAGQRLPPLWQAPGRAHLLREFGEFLSHLKPEHNTIHIRQRRSYLAELFGELLQFGAAYSNSLPPAGLTTPTACYPCPAMLAGPLPRRAGRRLQSAIPMARLATTTGRRLCLLAEQPPGRQRPAPGRNGIRLLARELAQDAGWQGQLDHLQQGVPA
jgi:CRISPR-associated protein Csy1